MLKVSMKMSNPHRMGKLCEDSIPFHLAEWNVQSQVIMPTARTVCGLWVENLSQSLYEHR